MLLAASAVHIFTTVNTVRFSHESDLDNLNSDSI